jgi:hypothetical protein
MPANPTLASPPIPAVPGIIPNIRGAFGLQVQAANTVDAGTGEPAFNANILHLYYR